MNPLFTPFTIGDLELRNRLVMAPMTRGRADAEGIPNDLMVEYYRQRAAAGLIITEGTFIDHPAANGYRDVPAFHGAALEGWKRVADAVHAEGSLIIPQLWHVGAVRRKNMEPKLDVPGMGRREHNGIDRGWDQISGGADGGE